MKINGASQIQLGTIPIGALQTGYSIPDANLASGSVFLKSSGSVAMTASFNFGSNTGINLAAPVNPTDAANKAYVDQKAGGIGGIHEVNWVQTTNIGLSGLTLQDGTATAGDIVLNTAQTTASQNGPWVTASGAWTRPTWWTSGTTQVPNQYFICGGTGTNNKDTKWWCSNSGSIVVDTTSVTFVQDTGSVYTAGTGITITGGVIAVSFGTTSTTAAAGNDSRITGALQTSSLGTGVATALGIAVNLSGGFPTLGTSGRLNATNFPALTGDVTSAGGSLATVVNNTSGTGFVKYTNHVINEVVSGTLNGTNTTFTLANTPAAVNGGTSSLMLMLNGVRQKPTSDYTLSSGTITMGVAPASTDVLTADYMI